MSKRKSSLITPHPTPPPGRPSRSQRSSAGGASRPDSQRSPARPSAAGGRTAPRDPRQARRVGLAACLAALALGVVLFLYHRHSRPPAVPIAAPAPSPPLPPAEQALRATVARLPQDPDAHRGLARYLLEQHRPFEALWHFRAAQDLPPADPDTPVQIARALARSGHPAQAISLLRSRLAAAPTDLEARHALAEAFLATARVPEALSALAGAGTALATSAPAQLLLGDARAVAGDRGGARAAYHRAVALEPEGAAGHDRLGRLALAEGKWAEAKQECGAARERDPGEAGYGYRLGQAYWGAGQRAEAERLWEEVAAGAPGYAPVQVALGKAYQSRKQWDAAAAHLVAAVRVAPASREAQFTLADVMTAQGDRASASYQRGLYYLETDRPHLALAEFRRMEAVAPNRVDGPRMISLAYTQMKRLDLAATAAQHGLERHPGDTRLLGDLGLLHLLGRNRPRAQQLCQDWLKSDPNAAEPYRLLAWIAREEQRLPEAQRLAEQALARDPQNPAVCSELAKTLDATRSPENRRRAIDLLQRATAASPQEPDYWQQLGSLLRGAGREAEAADAFLRALDLDAASLPSCSGLVSIAAQQARPGLAHFYAAMATELQNHKRAGDLLRRVTYRNPEDATAHGRLARFLLASADPRRASYQLQEVVRLRPGDGSARRDLALVQRLLDLQSE